jgi:NADP-dependent 3-hydroxy acid dehydrogenase YdfG
MNRTSQLSSGKALAEMPAGQGAKVAIAARRVERLEQVAA